jgi:uncharacterized protein YjiS (DUF1127 family)
MAYSITPHLKNALPSLVLPRLGETLRAWRQRTRERDELAQMSDGELHDIGLSRAAVFTELHKPFWQA